MSQVALTDTLLQIRRQRRFISNLVDNGWTETRAGLSLRLQWSWHGEGEDALDAVNKLSTCVTDASLSLSRGTFELKLPYSSQGFDVEQPQADIEIESIFDREERDLARSALSGIPADALALTGDWSIEIGINLSLPINQADPLRQWIYSESPEILAQEFKSCAWWNLRSLVQGDKHIVFLVDDDSPSWCESKSFSIVGWNTDPEKLSKTHIADGASYGSSIPADAPSLEALTIRKSSSCLSAQLEKQLLILGAAVAWAQLSNKVKICEDVAIIEYFGYQQASWKMRCHGPEISKRECLEVISLASWASDGNPDKVLAIRQVISLNQSPSLWNRAQEIARAAQPVFVALRNSAVTEALKSVREARSTAVSISRQTSDSATALTKGAVERTLATLAAIFGIVIARASQVIPPDTESLLRITGGCYLFVLAAWSIVIEGPIVTAGISALRKDVSSYSDFVSNEEAKLICSLDVVERARRQAWTVRAVVPMAYAGVGILILVIFR